MDANRYSLRLLLAMGLLSGRLLFATYEEPCGLIAGRVFNANTLYAAVLKQDTTLTPSITLTILENLPALEIITSNPPLVSISNNVGFILSNFKDPATSTAAPTAFLVYPTATYSVITLDSAFVNGPGSFITGGYKNGNGLFLGDNTHVCLIKNGVATTVSYTSNPTLLGVCAGVNNVGEAIICARSPSSAYNKVYRMDISTEVVTEVDITPLPSGQITGIILNDSGVALLNLLAGFTTETLYQIHANNTLDLVTLSPSMYIGGDPAINGNIVAQGYDATKFLVADYLTLYKVENLTATAISQISSGGFNAGAIAPGGSATLLIENANAVLHDLELNTMITLASGMDSTTGGLAVDDNKNAIFSMIQSYPTMNLYVQNSTNLTTFTFQPNIQQGSDIGAALGFAGVIPPPPTPDTPTNISDFGSSGQVSGNAEALASYFLNYAPDTLSFFLPSIQDGTIAEAMASVSPARNTQSSASASFNNSRSAGGVVSTRVKSQQANVSAKVNAQLLSSLSMPGNKKVDFDQLENKQSFWIQGIGCFAHQGAQSQTPSYNSSTGGVVLGYDRFINDYLQLGVGASYMYTSLKQGQNAGRSNVNQENIILYSALTDGYYYLDASLTGGFFQIHQVRNVQMTGFSAQAVSNPSGYNLVPHAEIGFNLERNKPKWVNGITFNPFVMLDWASTWQNAFSESGAAPFNMGQTAQYSSIVRTELGMRLTETVALKHCDLIFQEKGSYVNMQLFGVGTNTGFIVGSPGFFTLDALYSQLGLGAVQLMAVLEPHNKRYPSIDAIYQGEFSYIYISNQVSLGLTWHF